jgi:hypothetical protein
VGTSVLAALREAPDTDKSEARDLERQEQGNVAGELLRLIFQLGQHSPEDASLNKACVMLRELKARSANSEIRARPASLRYLEQCWQNFKNVAHLIAAFEVEDSFTDLDPESFTELIPVFSCAEALREFGEHHRAPIGPSGTGRSSKPLLDADETWRVPHELQLQKPVLKMQPLSLQQRKILEAYKVETSSRRQTD